MTSHRKVCGILAEHAIELFALCFLLAGRGGAAGDGYQMPTSRRMHLAWHGRACSVGVLEPYTSQTCILQRHTYYNRDMYTI